MKTCNVLIALSAVWLFSVSAQANDCCQFNPFTFPTIGCVSGPVGQFNIPACEEVFFGENEYVPNAFCDSTTFECTPKPGGDDNNICSFFGFPPGDTLPEDTCLAILGKLPGDDGIPTVSEWGLAIMALMLLIGAKVYFVRRRSPAASG